MNRFFDLNAETQAVIQEIMDYKWIESEKAGQDIGIKKAAHDWISKYYDTWFRYNYRKYIRER